VACRERQRILSRELLEAGVSAGPAHQTLARRFAECEPEADSRNCRHQHLVNVLDGLDEVSLAQNEVG